MFFKIVYLTICGCSVLFAGSREQAVNRVLAGPDNVQLVYPSPENEPIFFKTFNVGSERTIRWTGTATDTIDIFFSSDSGQQWIQVGAGIPSTVKRFIWQIPDSISTTCTIELRDASSQQILSRSERFAIDSFTSTFPLQVGNKWNTDGFSVRWYREVVGDTILSDGKLYAMVEHYSNGVSQPDDTLFLRQEGLKIMYPDSSIEVDFNLTAGDTFVHRGVETLIVYYDTEWNWPQLCSGVSQFSRYMIVGRPGPLPWTRNYVDGLGWSHPALNPFGRWESLLVGFEINGFLCGSLPWWVSIEDGSAQLFPKALALHQNYPNPFNPTTTIAFDLAVGSNVTLIVYDIRGREVATLLNEPRTPGYHEVAFDASELSTGVYFYRLEAGGFNETRRMLLLR